MKKRILSLCLVLAMVIGMLPMNVFAAEPAATNNYFASKGTAVVDGKLDESGWLLYAKNGSAKFGAMWDAGYLYLGGEGAGRPTIKVDGVAYTPDTAINGNNWETSVALTPEQVAKRVLNVTVGAWNGTIALSDATRSTVPVPVDKEDTKKDEIVSSVSDSTYGAAYDETTGEWNLTREYLKDGTNKTESDKYFSYFRLWNNADLKTTGTSVVEFDFVVDAMPSYYASASALKPAKNYAPTYGYMLSVTANEKNTGYHIGITNVAGELYLGVLLGATKDYKAEYVKLNKGLGEKFHLRFEYTPTGNLEIYVDDVLAKAVTGTFISTSLTSQTGYFLPTVFHKAGLEVKADGTNKVDVSMSGVRFSAIAADDAAAFDAAAKQDLLDRVEIAREAVTSIELPATIYSDIYGTQELVWTSDNKNYLDDAGNVVKRWRTDTPVEMIVALKADPSIKKTFTVAVKAVTGELDDGLVFINEKGESYIGFDIKNLSAAKSVEVALYDAALNELATTKLVNKDYLISDTLTCTVEITRQSSSWDTVWTNHPSADQVPVHAKLRLDGAVVSEAKVLFFNPDTPDVPAIDWEDVVGVLPVGEFTGNVNGELTDDKKDAYITATISGLIASESVEIYLFTADDELLATTTLTEAGKAAGNLKPAGDLPVTIEIGNELDENWETKWHVAPVANKVPAYVALILDNVWIDTADVKFFRGGFNKWYMGPGVAPYIDATDAYGFINDSGKDYVGVDMVDIYANKSIVLELYSGETLMAVTNLVKTEGNLFTEELSGTIEMSKESSSWDTEWKVEKIATIVPTHVVVIADGVVVDEIAVDAFLAAEDPEESLHWVDLPSVKATGELVSGTVFVDGDNSYISFELEDVYAKNNIRVAIYDQNGELLGTTRITDSGVKKGYLKGGDLTAVAEIAGDVSSSWQINWNVKPVGDRIPTTAKLFVDTTLFNTVEIEMNLPHEEDRNWIDVPGVDVTGTLTDGRVFVDGEDSRIYLEIADLYARKTVSVAVFDQNGELIARTDLVKTEGNLVKDLLGVVVEMTKKSSSWDTVWFADPIASKVPTTAMLIVDGIEMNTAKINLTEEWMDVPGVAISGTLQNGRVFDTDAIGGSRVVFDITDIYAQESIEIELYCGDELLSVTELTDAAKAKGYLRLGLLTANVEITYQSSSWDTKWLNAPNGSKQPTHAVLYVDGVKMNTAEVFVNVPGETVNPLDWVDVDGVLAVGALVDGAIFVNADGESYIGFDIADLYAKQSVELELYCGATLMARTKLNQAGIDKGYLRGEEMSAVFEITKESSSWDTTWLVTDWYGNQVPTHGVLYVDGVKINSIDVEGFLAFDESGKTHWVDLDEVAATGEATEAVVFDAADGSYIGVMVSDLYAKKSVTVKVFDAAGNLLATTELTEAGAAAAEHRQAAAIAVVEISKDSTAWDTKWEATPVASAIPATATLYIDGVEINTVEITSGKAWGDVTGVDPIGTLLDGMVFDVDGVSYITVEIEKLHAKKDVVVELYSGEELLATTTLVKTEGNLVSDLLSCCIEITRESSSWDTVWHTAPTGGKVPTHAVLILDGKVMNSAPIAMNVPGEPVVEWVEITGVAATGTLEDGLVFNGASGSYISFEIKDLYAKKSVAIEVYDANGKLLATTVLNEAGIKKGYMRNDLISAVVEITYQSSSWDTTWVEAPRADQVPAKATLFIDGVAANTVDVFVSNPYDENDNTEWSDVGGIASVMINENGVVKYFDTLADAIAQAKAGDVLQLLQDMDEATIVVNKAITLDLNGYTLEADHVVMFKGSNMIDTAADKGLLKVAKGNVMFQADNAQMPIWNEKDGYILTALNLSSEKISEGEGVVFKSMFKPSFGYASTAADAKSIAKQFFAENGMADNGLTVVLRLTWDIEGSTVSYDFEYSEELVKKVYGDPTNSTWFSLGVTSLASETVKVQVVVISDTGVETVSAGFTYPAN